MTPIRRLDHIAILVGDLDEALRYYADRLGLPLESVETVESYKVRVAYLDAGNVVFQLVQPLDAESPLGKALVERGEGVHHLCFAVDDVQAAARALADADAPEPTLVSGRGRPAAFVPGAVRHGTPIELNEFRRAEDVEARSGWLSS